MKVLLIGDDATVPEALAIKGVINIIEKKMLDITVNDFTYIDLAAESLRETISQNSFFVNTSKDKGVLFTFQMNNVIKLGFTPLSVYELKKLNNEKYIEIEER